MKYYKISSAQLLRLKALLEIVIDVTKSDYKRAEAEVDIGKMFIEISSQ